MIQVKYVHPARLLNKKQVDILTSKYIPVVPLSALREVVKGLREIAEPNQEPFATTTDAIRALSATLKMLNAARDKAQRLLASLGEVGK